MADKKEIPETVQWLMVGTAAFFDFFQFFIALALPFLGSIVGRIMTPMVWLTFYIWFKFYGMSFTKPKRLLTMLLGTGFEALLSELPAWTITILILTKGEKVLKKAAPIVPGGGEKIIGVVEKINKKGR